MTDLRDLYRVILARPADDTPRVVYADALDDAGDARRAAFIRAQVAAARVPEYDPVRVRFDHHDLPELFDPAWLDELPPLPAGLRWATAVFRRGFPAVVNAANGAAFADHAADLLAAYPIDTLILDAGQIAGLGGLTGCDELNRIGRLALASGVSGPAARRLFNSRNLGGLTELHVGAGMTVAAAARELVRSRAFRRLTGLSWRDDGRSGGTIVTELTQLADPPHLAKLDLSGNRITADRAGRLATAPALAGVDELDLGDNHLGPAGMAALAAARLPLLRVLRLARTGPRAEGVRALGTAAFAAGLRSLGLGGNHLGPAAAAELAASPGFAGLRVLDLGDNRLGDRGAEGLAESPHLATLLALDLSENGIEARGMSALAASPHLGGLLHLDLRLNQVTPATARRLTDRFGDRVRV